MRIQLLLSIATFLISSILTVSQAKNLYVNGSTGNDSVSYDSNSAATPWRSLGRAVWGSTSNTTPNTGEAARAGDTVIVAAGTYNTSAVTNARYIPLYNPANSGTAGSPITFRASGVVQLRSSDSAGTQPIIGTYQRNHIVWDGFTIDENFIPTRADTGPIVIWASNGVTLQNMDITGRIINWGDNHNAIRIEVADDIVIRNNRIRGIVESHGSCITTYQTSNLLIEHNDLSDSGDGIFIKGMNQGPVTIRYNKVTDTRNGIMLGQIGLSGEMSYVYQNLVTDSGLGGIIFIGYDNATPSHVTVANNTITTASLASDGGGILLRPEYGGYGNINFMNNIVVNSAAGVTSWGGDFESAVSFSHNNYYNNNRLAWIAYQDYTLFTWQDTFSKDTTGGSNVDPRFVAADNYRLAANSPLLASGLDVLDLDNDGSTNDAIPLGAYITGSESIGLIEGAGVTFMSPEVISSVPQP